MRSMGTNAFFIFPRNTPSEGMSKVSEPASEASVAKRSAALRCKRAE